MADQTIKNETIHPATVFSLNCHVITAQLLNRLNTQLYDVEKVYDFETEKAFVEVQIFA